MLKRDGGVMPMVLDDAPGLRVHFLQDSTFNRPKALAFFLFRSNLLYASPPPSSLPRSSRALADVLQDSTYQASSPAWYAALFLPRPVSSRPSTSDPFLPSATIPFSPHPPPIPPPSPPHPPHPPPDHPAGRGHGAGQRPRSLRAVTARLPELIKYVSEQVKTAELTQLAFDRQREQLRQSLANFNRKQPISLCAYRRNLALETPRYSVDELSAAVEAATLKDVLSFQRELLPDTLLEAFLVGNLEESEARRMVASVTAAPSAAPLAPAAIPVRRARIPTGKPLVRQYRAQPRRAQLGHGGLRPGRHG